MTALQQACADLVEMTEPFQMRQGADALQDFRISALRNSADTERDTECQF